MSHQENPVVPGGELVVTETVALEAIEKDGEIIVDEIVDIEAGDPSNLIVTLDNGQRFTVRIIAGARP